MGKEENHVLGKNFRGERFIKILDETLSTTYLLLVRAFGDNGGMGAFLVGEGDVSCGAGVTKV